MKKWHKGVDVRANVRLYLRGQKQTTNRELHMSYKELQSALKNYRNSGVVLQVKLNATKAALQAEYNRISGNSGSKQQPDELQQLRDQLAAAKRELAEAQDTIQAQAAIIEELRYQHTEREQQEQANWDAYVEENEPKYDAKCDTEADVIAQEVIEIFRDKGKKAAAKHIKRNLPKFHPDTCKQHGNVYCEATWLRLNTMIEWLEADNVSDYFGV